VLNVVFWLLTVLAGLAATCVLLVVTQLQRSDPAGNGLAQLWLVGCAALSWLLLLLLAVVEWCAGPPPGAGGVLLGIVGLGLGVSTGLLALPGLGSSRLRGGRRLALAGAVVAPPFAALAALLAHHGTLPPATKTAAAGVLLLAFALATLLRPRRRRAPTAGP